MKVLTVRQPWAQLLVEGHKPVENRTWMTKYRGPLVIHAGRRWDRAGAVLAQRLDVPAEVVQRAHDRMGMVVGVVRLVDVHDADADYDPGFYSGHCSPWAEKGDVRHWRVADAIALEQPLMADGMLGLWTPTPAIVEAIEAVLP